MPGLSIHLVPVRGIHVRSSNLLPAKVLSLMGTACGSVQVVCWSHLRSVEVIAVDI